jgi:predicted transport protein
MIAKKLTVIAESLLLRKQNGFRKGRSCMDCIFSASQIIEKYIEFNIVTNIAFIDLKKKPLTLWKETNYGPLCQVKKLKFIKLQQLRKYTKKTL